MIRPPSCQFAIFFCFQFSSAILLSAIAAFAMFRMLNEKGLSGQDCIAHYYDCTHWQCLGFLINDELYFWRLAHRAINRTTWEYSFNLNGHTFGFYSQTKKVRTTLYSIINSRYHMKALLNSFHLNGHTGFSDANVYTNQNKFFPTINIIKMFWNHFFALSPRRSNWHDQHSKVYIFLLAKTQNKNSHLLYLVSS